MPKLVASTPSGASGSSRDCSVQVLIDAASTAKTPTERTRALDIISLNCRAKKYSFDECLQIAQALPRHQLAERIPGGWKRSEHGDYIQKIEETFAIMDASYSGHLPTKHLEKLMATQFYGWESAQLPKPKN